MGFRPLQARHVIHYPINVLTELAGKQDSARNKATATWLAGSLKQREQEKEKARG